jgi:excisionase family DNA binding protein
MIPDDVMRYISMDEISRGDLSGIEPGERDEAIKQFAQGMSNLAVLPTAPATAPAAGDKLLYDAAAAAKYLTVAKSFIRKAYRSGKLPGIPMGARYVRFTKAALDAFALGGDVR